MRLAQLKQALSPKTDMDRMHIANWVKSGKIPDPKSTKGNYAIRKEILKLEQNLLKNVSTIKDGFVAVVL